MYPFYWHRPRSLDAAVLTFQNAADGKFLAGGQTLLPTMKQRLAQPSDIIDLSGIPDLDNIRKDGDGVEIGAMVLHAKVAASAEVRLWIPALAELAVQIGDPQVRNRGTLGGSVANADPAADYPAAVLGTGATVQTNTRAIAADDFFIDLFQTALKDDEIITAIRFPIPRRAAYIKFPNPASGYAIVGVCVCQFTTATTTKVRVAVTGAGYRVFRVTAMEAALEHCFSPDAVTAITIPETGLNEDIHASAGYRASLLTVIAKRAVAQAIAGSPIED